MTARWQLLQELFDEAVELDAERRARLLGERAGGDAELAREVEALVAADRTPPGELERSAVELLSALGPEPPAAELCGTAFGAYRVEEHVSSGGMGHVYRATRSAAGTERRVALKVLRHGLDLAAFLARFQRERQVLAALEHEHIVAFLDAGALPDGRPFLVMEYVDGVPLTDWARATHATLRRRVELFVQVAAAVQYAHQMLVVHRDLKPSNVLVTAQGVPKLLDFGVASVVEDEPEPAGRGPLTPSYAAPEELAGAPPTTAGDVYSLGVLLHELLTGELPRTGGTPGLGGDLDAIVAQALEADPARRYPSADRWPTTRAGTSPATPSAPAPGAGGIAQRASRGAGAGHCSRRRRSSRRSSSAGSAPTSSAAAPSASPRAAGAPTQRPRSRRACSRAGSSPGPRATASSARAPRRTSRRRWRAISAGSPRPRRSCA